MSVLLWAKRSHVSRLYYWLEYLFNDNSTRPQCRLRTDRESMILDWERLGKILKEHHSFVLTSHIRPDCDALGSELGMAGVLEGMGKHVEIVNGHPTPPGLSFLDPSQRIKTLGEHITAEEIEADCMIVLECVGAARAYG
jgi:hypothetical protein